MRQISFDPLDYELVPGRCGVETARQARDKEYFRLRKLGVNVSRWALTNQLRKYESLDVPDGRVRNVYFLNVMDGSI